MDVTTPQDLTPEIRERIIGVALDWAGEGQIDWDDLLNRIERYCDIDLPTDMTDPVIRSIQRSVREARREARG